MHHIYSNVFNYKEIIERKNKNSTNTFLSYQTTVKNINLMVINVSISSICNSDICLVYKIVGRVDILVYPTCTYKE